MCIYAMYSYNVTSPSIIDPFFHDAQSVDLPFARHRRYTTYICPPNELTSILRFIGLSEPITISARIILSFNQISLLNTMTIIFIFVSWNFLFSFFFFVSFLFFLLFPFSFSFFVFLNISQIINQCHRTFSVVVFDYLWWGISIAKRKMKKIKKISRIWTNVKKVVSFIRVSFEGATTFHHSQPFPWPLLRSWKNERRVERIYRTKIIPYKSIASRKKK